MGSHMSHDKRASEKKSCCEPESITRNPPRNQCEPEYTEVLRSLGFNAYRDEENDWISQLLFTNIGKTVIEIPDFTFYYDLEVDPKYLVTEEIWNSFFNTKN